MSAKHHAGRWPALWRAVCRAARAVGRAHAEQVYGWEVWLQANRAGAPVDGPLRWVLSLDGYRLAGSHLSADSDTTTGGTP